MMVPFDDNGATHNTHTTHNRPTFWYEQSIPVMSASRDTNGSGQAGTGQNGAASGWNGSGQNGHGWGGGLH